MSWLVLAVVLAGHPAGLHLGGLVIHPATACCVIADLAEPGDLVLQPAIASHAGAALVVPRALVSVAPRTGRPASRPGVRRVPPASDDEPPQRSA